nr:LysR substrate-binding domain-containing protein [Streptomyces sp. CB00455]
MVAGGQGVTVLPNWVGAPYVSSHGLALVRMGEQPMTRTWFCATRTGPRPPHIEAFVEELATRLTAPVGPSPGLLPEPHRVSTFPGRSPERSGSAGSTPLRS